MRIQRLTVPLLFLMALAACIPQQNNPEDPHNRPVAVLQMVDRTEQGGSCPPVTSASGGNQVIAASRVRCLALDAVGSTSPTAGTLLYSFALVSTDGGGTLLNPPRDIPETASGIAALDSSFRLHTVPGKFLVFQVTVANQASGGFGTAQTTAELVDDVPVARGDAPRYFPVGGFPWTLGAPFTITFSDHGSTDPDGVAIASYCWLLPPATIPVCSSNPADPAFQVQLPADIATIYTATYTVSDGYQFSLPVNVTVTVGDPSQWIEDGVTLALLDPQRSALPAPPGSDYLGTAARYGTNFVIALGIPGHLNPFPATNTTVVAQMESFPFGNSSGPAITVTPSPGPTPVIAAAVAGDPVHGKAWGCIGVPGLGAEMLQFDVVDNSNLSMVGSPVGLGALGDAPTEVVVDGLGSAWCTATTRFPFTTLTAVSPAGTVTHLFTATNGLLVTALGARPASNEVWTIVNSLSALGVPPAQAATIIRYSDSIGFAATSWPVSIAGVTFDKVHDLAWLPDGFRFWVMVEGEGMLLVDANQFTQSGDLGSSIILSVPQVSGTYGAVVDPISGSVWTSFLPSFSSPQLLYRIGVDGSLATYTSDSQPLFVDQGEFLWVYDPTVPEAISRGLNPLPDTVTRILGEASADALDPTTGGIWSLNQSTGLLFELATDGSVLRTISRVVGTNGSGQDFLFPDVAGLQLSPDASYALGENRSIVEAGGLSRIVGLAFFDLTQDPPVEKQVVSSLGGFSSNTISGATFFTPRPIPGSSPTYLFAIQTGVVETNGTGFTYDQVSTVPLPSNPFAAFSLLYQIPESFNPQTVNSGPFGSPSMVSDNLCTLDAGGNGTNTAFLRVIGKDGSVLVLDSSASQAELTAYAVSAANSVLSGDTCWEGYATTTGTLSLAQGVIEGWTLNGLPVHLPILQTGLPIALSAPSPELIYAIWEEPNPASPGATQYLSIRYSWDGSAWLGTAFGDPLGDQTNLVKRDPIGPPVE